MHLSGCLLLLILEVEDIFYRFLFPLASHVRFVLVKITVSLQFIYLSIYLPLHPFPLSLPSLCSLSSSPSSSPSTYVCLCVTRVSPSLSPSLLPLSLHSKSKLMNNREAQRKSCYRSAPTQSRTRKCAPGFQHSISSTKQQKVTQA